jgi:hypothetical protein
MSMGILQQYSRYAGVAHARHRVQILRPESDQ